MGYRTLWTKPTMFKVVGVEVGNPNRCNGTPGMGYVEVFNHTRSAEGEIKMELSKELS